MFVTQKRFYWRLREALSLWHERLRKDPLRQRMSRFVQTQCRRTVNIDGIAIRLSPQMGSGPIAYMLQGAYETEERRIVEYALSCGDRVLELGTGIGYLSALCARKLGNDNVLSFEANPMLRPLIERTYRVNGVSPRAEFCILGEHDGNASFNVAEEFWASSTTRGKRRSLKITVPMKAFNDVLTTYKPTFLIIDIEGGEADLIRYARLDGVTKVCLELHPWAIGAELERQVRDFFIEHGFREDVTVSDDTHVLYLRD